jgi:hypothetical protein
MSDRRVRTRVADENNVVVTVTGSPSGCLSTPCPECPFRKGNAGKFPAEAFRLSAHCADEGSMHRFSCHTAGIDDIKICAGFALRCHHNFGLRMDFITGRIPELVDPGDLFKSYRDMAVANGVDPDDPSLYRCR